MTVTRLCCATLVLLLTFCLVLSVVHQVDDGKAATTRPANSDSKLGVTRAAKLHNATLVFPWDILRLASATKDRPKHLLKSLEPLGFVLGERRLLAWRKLVTQTRSEVIDSTAEGLKDDTLISSSPALEDGRLSEQRQVSEKESLRAAFPKATADQLRNMRKTFLPYSEVVRAFGSDFHRDKLLGNFQESSVLHKLWTLWYPSVAVIPSQGVSRLKEMLRAADLPSEITDAPRARSRLKMLADASANDIRKP
eukprot:956456-Prorocentrum_minimum.AAC.4